MASRAVWRRLPGDPRSGLGWVARDRRRWIVALLMRAIVGLVALAGYAVLVGKALPAALLVVTTLCLIGLFPSRERGPRAAEPSPGMAFSGSCEVWRAGVRLGADRVVATFVDGWLYVEGLRTNFALRSEDVGEIRASALLFGDGTEVRFHVALDPDEDRRPGSVAKTDPLGFERRLQRWLLEPVPSGDSVLPPDRPHPAAMPRAAADLAIASLGFLAGVATSVLFGYGWGVATFLLAPGPPIHVAVAALARLRRAKKGV